MSKEKLFRTYIVTYPSKAAQIDGTGIDGEWHISIQDEASRCHWTNPDEKSRMTIIQKTGNTRIRKKKKDIPCKEVLIKTHDDGIAENVSSLIQTGTLLGYPDMFSAPKYFGANEIVKKTEKFMSEEPFCNRFTFQENTVYGCKIAAAAWSETSVRYSIEKYRLSLELDSFTPHSASPTNGQTFLNQYPDYSYHVRAATAILVAFSIIEELGIEIRSSNKNQRFIDSKWNLSVKEDIEKRLQKRGVDLSEPEIWVYRGKPSKLELDIKPNLGIPTEYADGKVVRDQKMEIVDAIHKASYIRNYIIAHKYSDLVSEISPYDVHNVQLLARRLILSSLGLYKVSDSSLLST